MSKAMPLARLAIWVLASVPAWLVFGLTGGLAPIWQFLLAAAVIGLLDGRLAPARPWATPLLAALLPLAAAAIALDLPPAGWLAGLAGMAAVAGIALGRLDRLPQPSASRLGLVPIGLALGLAGVLAVNTLLPRTHGPWVPLPRLFTFNVMIMPVVVPETERVVLTSGAVAWFSPAESDGPAPLAVFFHGADSRGSAQPAAVVARRALLDAGFAVLAVDHPGFGESPVPDLADVEQWDPLPTARAAVDWLADYHGGNPITIVGHSKGASDVLRLLVSGQRPAAAVLMGAGVIDPLDPSDEDQYWVHRLRSDRSLPADALDTATIARIWSAYYDNAALAKGLSEDGPPIQLVEFGIEFPDVVLARDRTRALLPRRTVLHDLAGVGHYFDSRRRGDVVLADARAYETTVDYFEGMPPR